MKTKLILYYPYLTIANIYDAKERFSKEEMAEIDKKFLEVTSHMKFRDADSQALAEKMFTWGYISGHVVYQEEAVQ